MLFKELDSLKKFEGQNFFTNKLDEDIKYNLADKFKLREYQSEAFGRFIYFYNKFIESRKKDSRHLLYHMATGSGKTLIMAGLIIYLYKKGYRNFLFFVNSTNIINKTRENFLNSTSSKYLFSNELNIESRQVNVQEVNNFDASNSKDINIVFTTIQGLHSRLNEPKENSITYEDFVDSNVVLISDEAHHINAETKKDYKLTKTEERNVNTWEETVSKIFNASDDNILLEFTATIDKGNPAIREKYENKIIFDYPLKKFRNDGFSKDVKLLQTDTGKFRRAVQALLISQYRKKVFGKYKKIVKPVILFKSRTIKDSESFYETFHNKLAELSNEDLEKIKRDSRGNDNILQEVFTYFEKESISLSNLASELKLDFSEARCLRINSKRESEENQVAVNTLEDNSNRFRAVFAVDKLNEGWDVLNLFDIVRLYNTRDAKSGKPGKTTMAEAQLIGRGARYFPFKINEDHPLYKRKYDVRDDEKEKHELKICEELFYHSAHNPRYIDELNTALEEVGIKPKKEVERKLEIKDSFKKTDTYLEGVVFSNRKRSYKREDIYALDQEIKNEEYYYRFNTGYNISTRIFKKVENGSLPLVTNNYKMGDFGELVIRKAINGIPFYRFSNLKKIFPNLESISQFIKSDDYLAQLMIVLAGPKRIFENFSKQNKLIAVKDILSKQLIPKIRNQNVSYKGTKEFTPTRIKEVFRNKILKFSIDDSDDDTLGSSQINSPDPEIQLNLKNKKWYIYNDNFGTKEEKRLVKYIDSKYEDLQEKFDKVYLLRNEEYLDIYDFDKGRTFRPDFILLLKNRKDKEIGLQIFIEPKGEHLLEKDDWKEQFLSEIKNKHKIINMTEDKDFSIWGLPFFNKEQNMREFKSKFNNIFS